MRRRGRTSVISASVIGFSASSTVGSGQLGPVALAVAQLDSADLPGQGLGQVIDELDPARIGVGGEVPADEGLDLTGELVRLLIALRQHDGSLDDVAAALV